jgi:ergothioneine biosynthesis protein EgtB
MFDMLDPDVYYQRPISLRNPIVFYEGHIPAFAVNALIKKALGKKGIDEHLETIFARGIDPDSEAAAIARGNPAWPTRETVRQYNEAADRLITDAIDHEDLDRPGHPLLDRAQALWTILEHEEMHQETLGYIWHQLPHSQKRAPAGYTAATVGAAVAVSRRIQIPAGIATLGTDDAVPFAWDNERRAHRVRVGAFTVDAFNVTNGQFLEFVEAGGYLEPRWWRPDDWAWMKAENISHPQFWSRQGSGWSYCAMFEPIALPHDWPVYVTWAEANAFARWKGRRLPTEAEYHRAAFGSHEGAERLFPWGNVLHQPVPGNFDFRRWDPEPVGSQPAGASAFGVHDLIGNGWEWTGTVFGPFEGFEPLPSYPEYSADFFDGEHFVMKGASPLTSRFLVRRGFRNWFRPRYPYVYATFRCVEGA